MGRVRTVFQCQTPTLAQNLCASSIDANTTSTTTTTSLGNDGSLPKTCLHTNTKTLVVDRPERMLVDRDKELKYNVVAENTVDILGNFARVDSVKGAAANGVKMDLKKVNCT